MLEYMIQKLLGMDRDSIPSGRHSTMIALFTASRSTICLRIYLSLCCCPRLKNRAASILAASSALLLEPTPVRISRSRTQIQIPFKYDTSPFFYLLSQYGQSKLAQIMHMKELQKRLDAELPPGERGSPILAVSCTPGMTHTPLMDSFFSKTMTVGLRSALKQCN